LTSGFRWDAGDQALKKTLEPLLAAPHSYPQEIFGDSLDPADGNHSQRSEMDRQAIPTTTRRGDRRRLSRVELDSGEAVFVKQFTTSKQSTPRRVRRALGFDTASREWRTLVSLHQAGIAVPKPLALGALPDGSQVLVTQFLVGQNLKASLATPRRDRLPLLIAVGKLIAELHAQGYVHGDLHGENIFVTSRGPVLLDFQETSRRSSLRARYRDLGELDFALSPLVSLSDRMRVRAIALGFATPFSPEQRSALRAVGRASLARGRSHAASRTRRSLRPGRAFARLKLDGQSGMRIRDVSAAEIAAALELESEATPCATHRIIKHDARAQVSEVKTDHGSWIVKRYQAGGILRRAADLFRGSPARRAWRGGHGLRARRIGVATPIAFLERRVWGIPVASAVVLENLQSLEAADQCDGQGTSEREVVDAIVRLAIQLHRRGVHHGDLKASHVLLEHAPAGFEGRLIDLEGVRFRRRLGDRERIQALAELNASLPDRFSAELRCRAFARYAAAVPFQGEAKDALTRIVEISLERKHRWTGADCEIAQAVQARGKPSS
jgi:tRNA A-37 threonylcarbamoyl transferase component Bud32